MLKLCIWNQAVQVIYEEMGLLLFALEIQPPGMKSRVFLNPGSFELPNPVDFGLFGFVVAEDQSEADILSIVSTTATSSADRDIPTYSKEMKETFATLESSISELKKSRTLNRERSRSAEINESQLAKMQKKHSTATGLHWREVKRLESIKDVSFPDI